MSIPYEASGRTAQKVRTREALVGAARELVAAGQTPTVDEAARAARVSRTTAYRYFPSKRDLLLAAHPETAATSLLPDDPPDDPSARLDAVIAAFTSLIVDTEPQQRTMLRLSLEVTPPDPDNLPLRQGRAIGWIREALQDLEDQLPDSELSNLILAIRATTGIEALVWLTDVAGLTRPAATDLMRWSARSLLRQALVERPPVAR